MKEEKTYKIMFKNEYFYFFEFIVLNRGNGKKVW